MENFPILIKMSGQKVQLKAILEHADETLTSILIISTAMWNFCIVYQLHMFITLY